MTEPFDVRVSADAPRRAAVVAPERDVRTGRYGGAGDRDAKHRHPDEPRSARQRRMRGPRRPRELRWPRPWQFAAGGVAVVAAAGGGLLFAGGDGGQSAPTTNPVAAVTQASIAAAAGPATAAGGSAAAVGVPTTAAAIPAPTATTQPSAAATVPAVTSTSVTSTTLEDEANGLAGRYQFTMTITDGNENFPVGTSQNATVAFRADCPGSSCSVSSPAYPGATWSFDGTNLTTSLSVPEPCPNGEGSSTTTEVDIALRVADRGEAGRVSSLTGTQVQSTPDVSGCPNAINDPITWGIIATRAG